VRFSYLGVTDGQIFLLNALFLLMLSHCGEGAALCAVGQEVGRVEPAFEDCFAGGPLAVEDGEPCCVAVSALHDHVLAEDAFKLEAVAEGGSSRGLVECVALPFVAAVSQIFEGVLCEEIHGFGAAGCSLQTGCEEDVAYFYSAIAGFDGEVGGETDGVARVVVDDCEVEAVLCGSGGEIGFEGCEVGWRVVPEKAPELLVVCAVRGLEERCSLEVGIDGSERDESSCEDDGLGELRMWPIDGLIKLPLVEFVRGVHEIAR
jgi:hypothetical protein